MSDYLENYIVYQQRLGAALVDINKPKNYNKQKKNDLGEISLVRIIKETDLTQRCGKPFARIQFSVAQFTSYFCAQAGTTTINGLWFLSYGY